MTSSETIRAVVFVSLAILGCLIRTYIRTANGEKEDEAHFWSSRFSQLQQQDADEPEKVVSHYTRSSNTSSGEVSRAVSVLHEQPARFPPFLAEIGPTDEPDFIQTCEGAEVDEAYEDWAAMHHARGAVSEDAEASIDSLLQRRQLQKAMHMQAIHQFDALGTSGANTPTIWTAHFPAAQLRPY